MKHGLSYGLKFVTLNESLIRSFRHATTSISTDELSHQLVQGLHPADGVLTHRPAVTVQWLRLAGAASRRRSAQHRGHRHALVDGRCARAKINGAGTCAEDYGHP